MLIFGTLPGICFAGGMTSLLFERKIGIFDYPKFAEPYRNRIRENAEQIRHHQLHFTQAYAKVEVHPYAVRDNLFRKSITTIRIGWHLIRITSVPCDSALVRQRLRKLGVLPPRSKKKGTESSNQ